MSMVLKQARKPTIFFFLLCSLYDNSSIYRCGLNSLMKDTLITSTFNARLLKLEERGEHKVDAQGTISMRMLSVLNLF